jgi:hypothetical protein
MNRRKFLQFTSVGAAVAVVTPSAILTTGCSFSVTGTLNIIIEAIQGILGYVGTSQPWAVDLSNALAALEAAESSWKAGGDATLVIDALNALEAVTAVIPFTAIYSPLIDLIVAGIDSIINHFAPQGTTRATVRTNPHIGRVAIKGPSFLHPTYAEAFKNQYNDTATGIGLPQLKIQ